MKKDFKDLLHGYKVEAFKISHGNQGVEDTTREILQSTEQALNNAYHYHFRRDPDAASIESFKRIKNYTLEALLPPVLEKLLRRIVVLEKQHAGLVKLVEDILEKLSESDIRADKDAG